MSLIGLQSSHPEQRGRGEQERRPQRGATPVNSQPPTSNVQECGWHVAPTQEQKPRSKMHAGAADGRPDRERPRFRGRPSRSTSGVR